VIKVHDLLLICLTVTAVLYKV